MFREWPAGTQPVATRRHRARRPARRRSLDRSLAPHVRVTARQPARAAPTDSAAQPRDTPAGRSRDATTTREGRGPAGNRGRAAQRRDQKAAGEDSQSPVVRTIEKIVAVVPTVVWIALGVLLTLSMILGARTFIERRRACELDRDRQRLMRDVNALERALLPGVPEILGALAVSVAHRASEGPPRAATSMTPSSSPVDRLRSSSGTSPATGRTPSSAPTRFGPFCTTESRGVSRRAPRSSVPGAARASSRAPSLQPRSWPFTTRQMPRSPTRRPDTPPIIVGRECTSRSPRPPHRRSAQVSGRGSASRGFPFPRGPSHASSRMACSRRACRMT